MTITPDQLPNRISNFIAYGPEERAADPATGDVITIRPQVYLRYYPAIIVNDMKEGGRSGDRQGLVTVYFDPTSVGFKEPISAHMNADDRTIPILRNSLENQVPVTIAIETQRKKKNSENGSPISSLTPIHALRGAKHPNGEGDGRTMMGPSGNNTSNRVAFVNGQGTQHIQTNPAEWKSLVNNKAGDLPPEGWRNFASGENWQEIGAAVRSGGPAPAQGQAPTASGAFPTPDQLGHLIQNVVSQTFKDFAPTLADQIAAATSPRRPSGTFDEGKPWNPRTSDGRINLGGYVVAGERWVFEWSYQYLTEELEIEASSEDAWSLTEVVMSMSNDVQANAYGHGFVADRASASHREAEHWVQWAISKVHAYPGVDADEETLNGWSEEVTTEATSLLVEAGRRAGDYFASVSKRDKNGAAPQSGNAKGNDGPSGPSEKVVRAFLDVIEKGWNNSDTLRNLGAQGRANGYLALPVSMSTTDEGVHISYPPAEGEQSGPLESLLIYRLQSLDQPEGAVGTDQGQPPSQEAANAPQEAAPAQERPSVSQEWNSESDEVASIIERLKTVSDEQSLRAIYEDAREANLTAARVFVAPGQNGEVLFGQEGQEGFQAQSIGQVIGLMRQAFTAPISSGQAEEPGQAKAKTDKATAQEESTPESEAPAENPESKEQGTPDTDSAPAPQEESPAESQPEDSPAQQDTGDGESEAQRIADAAGNAGSLDEITALRAEAAEKGLSGATVMVGGTEGGLELWIKHQERRVARAQRTRK